MQWCEALSAKLFPWMSDVLMSVCLPFIFIKTSIRIKHALDRIWTKLWRVNCKKWQRRFTGQCLVFATITAADMLCVCVCLQPNLISFDNEHLLQPCFATLLNGRTQFGAKRRGKLAAASLGEAQITPSYRSREGKWVVTPNMGAKPTLVVLQLCFLLVDRLQKKIVCDPQSPLALTVLNHCLFSAVQKFRTISPFSGCSHLSSPFEWDLLCRLKR